MCDKIHKTNKYFIYHKYINFYRNAGEIIFSKFQGKYEKLKITCIYIILKQL